MNFPEFQRLLASDPNSQDPEFLRLKREDPQCAEAAARAEAFEGKLQSAIAVDVPDDLASRIHSRIAQAESEPEAATPRRSGLVPLALAASLALAAGFGIAYWYLDRPSGNITEFVAKTMTEEVFMLLEPEDLPQAELSAMLAKLDTRIEGELGQVRFAKYCEVPGGEGVRMVLMTDAGPVNLLYMPDADLDKRIDIEINRMSGRVLALEKGAAAIFGENDVALAQVEQQVMQTLRPEG